MINYCDHHSGTLASSPTQLNPYKLGIELFRDIEDRWNRGAFGKEYDDCDDYAPNARLGHGRRPGPGEDLRGPPDPQRPDVHRRVPDARFLPRAQAVFVRLQRRQRATTKSRAASFPKIKQQLLFSLTNMGRPIICVRDGNYKNRGELFLRASTSTASS